MSSLRPAPQLIPLDPNDKGPGSGSGPGGSGGAGASGAGGASGAAAPGDAASPLVCQKCKKSVVIHDQKAVTDLAVQTFASPLGHMADTDDERQRLVQRDTWVLEQLGEAFVMAPSATYNYRAPKDPVSGHTMPTRDADKKMAAIQTLFEIGTERAGHDMPLCTGCSDAILADNDKKLRALEAERDQYKQALLGFDKELKAMQARNTPMFAASTIATAAAAAKGSSSSSSSAAAANGGDDVPPPPPPPEDQDLSALLLAATTAAPPTNAELEKQLAAEDVLNAKAEREILEQIEQIQRERLALKTELKTLELENKNLDAFEARFWADYQDLQLDLDKFADEQTSVKQKIRASVEQLARMKRTNVYDDTFHIAYDGHFGTINGFRLGKLQSLNVEWAEINAALGQVVLLLHTVARQCNFKFTRYRLLPMGSFSKVGKKDDKESAANELFGSGEALLTRLFWFRRFDTALEWLLACVKELSDHAALTDKTFKQRYPIKDEYIGGISIKLQFNQDAKWTKALKYLLTNLKYLLVWSSKRYD